MNFKNESKNIVHRSVAPESPESLLVMQITRIHSKSAESKSAFFKRSLDESLNVQ